MPVLALTLATAMVIGGGLIIDTVAAGQRAASWASVGADARVTAPVSDADVQRAAAMSGVDAAGSFIATPQIGLTGGPATSFVTLVAVDPGYADVVAALAGTPIAGKAGDGARLRALATNVDADRLPALADPELVDRLSGVRDLVITVGGLNVRIEVVGSVASRPGTVPGSLVFVDRAALESRLGTSLVADTTLLVGSGAAEAARSIPDGQVLTRAQWIGDQRHEALVSGVSRVMLVSTASVAGLAVIALLAGVLAGARSRARSLALLRTLGMRSRLGWWLAVAETMPVVIAALVGGILSGFGIVLLLGPSLGLATLAGSSGTPPPSVSPSIAIGVAGAAVALLFVAMVVEMLAQRRDRLSDVLRVGETI